jgi:hypothetical protein
VSVFINSVSMLIAILDLSGHCNGYWITVAVTHNITYAYIGGYLQFMSVPDVSELCSVHVFDYSICSFLIDSTQVTIISQKPGYYEGNIQSCRNHHIQY